MTLFAQVIMSEANGTNYDGISAIGPKELNTSFLVCDFGDRACINQRKHQYRVLQSSCNARSKRK